MGKDIPIITTNPATTQPLSPFVTFREQAAEADLWGKKKGNWLVSIVGRWWQKAQCLWDLVRKHQPWNCGFRLSQGFLCGLSGFQHQLSLQMPLGRSKKLKNPWHVSEGFQRWTSSSSFFFLFFPPKYKCREWRLHSSYSPNLAVMAVLLQCLIKA